jgi:hypothetical protein
MVSMHLNREQFVLAALATGGDALYSPVQIQKLLFLLQERDRKTFDYRPFEFQPYDYGPFNREVYHVLDELNRKGELEIIGLPFEKGRRYRLTATGIEAGRKILETLPPSSQGLARALSKFVRSLPFSQLVSAIYREYPEMKKNSIFND